MHIGYVTKIWTLRRPLASITLLLLLPWAVTAQTGAPVAPFTISTHNEPGAGSVNSYWLTTAEGVVVIDTQRTPESAGKLVAQLKATGKPVVGIIITHPHPDHGRGLAVLAKAFPDAAIYSSQATLDALRADKFDYFADDLPLPTKVLIPDRETIIGGVSFISDEIGAGEAEAMTMLFVPSENILFSSDSISGAKMTPFLIEGRSAAWLEQLDRVASKYKRVKTVYPGHGANGDFSGLIEDQISYLRTFQRLVANQLKKGAMTPEGKQTIVSEMQRRYSSYTPVAYAPRTLETNQQLLELNIDGVGKELAPARGTRVPRAGRP